MRSICGLGLLTCAIGLAAARPVAADDTPGDARSVDEWIERLGSEDEETCREAAEALGKMGPKAEEAIPALMDVLKKRGYDRMAGTAAMEALSKVGSAAIPPLVALLRTDEPDRRHEAVTALGAIGGESATAVLDLLKDEDMEVRTAAIRVLGEVGRTTGEVHPALLAVLKDDGGDADLRTQAVWAASWCRKGGIAALCDALRDKSDRIRATAAEVLGGLCRTDRPSLERAGQERREEDRTLGTDTALVVCALAEALHDPEMKVRGAAVKALFSLEGDAPEAIPALEQALRDEDHAFRAAAARALLLSGQATDEVLAAVLEGIEGHDPTADLGRFGESNAPRLVHELRNPSEQVRHAVEKALGTLSSTPESLLVDLLGDPEPSIRASAARALGWSGEGGESAVPKLQDLLVNPKEPTEVRHDAAWALAGMGNRAENALLHGGVIGDAIARREVVRALACHAPDDRPHVAEEGATPRRREGGPPSEQVILQLSGALSDADAAVRAGAAETLGKMGEHGRVAIPALERAAQDEEEEVRAAARKALEEVRK